MSDPILDHLELSELDRNFLVFLEHNHPSYLVYDSFVQGVLEQVQNQNPEASENELDTLFSRTR